MVRFGRFVVCLAIGYVGPEVSRFVDGVRFKHTSGRGTGKVEAKLVGLESRSTG